MWVDHKSGAHDAYIADRKGLSMCIPFWDVGTDLSLSTWFVTLSLEDRYFNTSISTVFIDDVCSDSNWNILLLLIPPENTSPHSVR